jgi:hypothetical protein
MIWCWTRFGTSRLGAYKVAILGLLDENYNQIDICVT